jgi:hypothetical protein
VSPPRCTFDFLPSLGCLSSFQSFSAQYLHHYHQLLPSRFVSACADCYHRTCLVTCCSANKQYTRSETLITDPWIRCGRRHCHTSHTTWHADPAVQRGITSHSRLLLYIYAAQLHDGVVKLPQRKRVSLNPAMISGESRTSRKTERSPGPLPYAEKGVARSIVTGWTRITNDKCLANF